MELQFSREKERMIWLVLFGWKMRERLGTRSDERLWKGALKKSFMHSQDQLDLDWS